MFMSILHTPLKIKDITIKNRIMMSPMCMYTASTEGIPNDWHIVHYATRAIGGVGLIMQEATAVESRGRITDRDLGIWNDEQAKELKKIVDICKANGAAVGIQLAHAGRKCDILYEDVVGPSPIKAGDNYKLPRELSIEEIKSIVKAFGEAARRAHLAGYDVVEIHAAHGYLIHEFLSPLSNKRKDEYGGSIENRARFLIEVIEEVRKNWPQTKPIFVRVSADDYIEGGINIDMMVDYINMIKDKVDLIDVSSGGLLSADINLYPGYQVKYAETIKKRCNIKTSAVGLITTQELAEEILSNKRADLVALGRELLRNPYWVLHTYTSREDWPKQYERAFKK
jgi:NADPH2 dehydrogenase